MAIRVLCLNLVRVHGGATSPTLTPLNLTSLLNLSYFFLANASTQLTATSMGKGSDLQNGAHLIVMVMNPMSSEGFG